jgi:hypothetical protein
LLLAYFSTDICTYMYMYIYLPILSICERILSWLHIIGKVNMSKRRTPYAYATLVYNVVPKPPMICNFMPHCSQSKPLLIGIVPIYTETASVLTRVSTKQRPKTYKAKTPHYKTKTYKTKDPTTTKPRHTKQRTHASKPSRTKQRPHT